ncbi:MAG: ATP-binding protein, partial [Gammaproteobacteria bacterium]|nr:ATP-binding protein [Gammaproteobacteria bacterium]
IKQIVENNQAYADIYGIKYRFHGLVHEIMVNADAHRLSQVVSNLLSNAAKFSVPGKDVLVDVSMPNKNTVRISVTNFGKGIPEHYGASLFDRFTQVLENNDVKKGTGLGLSISRAIIEKHHGTIHYQSTPNDKTTFYFDLNILNNT